MKLTASVEYVNEDAPEGSVVFSGGDDRIMWGYPQGDGGWKIGVSTPEEFEEGSFGGDWIFMTPAEARASVEAMEKK